MRKIFVVMFVLVCLGGNVFAANGDLIVNGNVGVGVTSPTYKLDVAGVIHATQGTALYQVPYSNVCGSVYYRGLFNDSSCQYAVTPGTILTTSQIYYDNGFGCYACSSGNGTLLGRLIAP